MQVGASDLMRGCMCACVHAHVRGTYAYALCCGEVRHGVTSGVARDISKNRLGVCFKEV